MTKIKEQLLPCPCGGKAKLINEGAKWFNGVECQKCGLNIYFFHTKGKQKDVNIGWNEESPIKVIRAWNKHVSRIGK